LAVHYLADDENDQKGKIDQETLREEQPVTKGKT
jgi:hypothetical protein